MAVTYEPIATTTLGSANSTITFSSISASYTDLRLILIGTASTSANAYARVNSDSGSNYSVTVLSADGSTASSTRAANQTYINLQYNSFFKSAQPTLITADFFSYAGSTFKSILSQTAADVNGSGYVESCVNLWRSTSAINRIDLIMQSGTFSVGTTATLYGILKA
jgi:hypothetical protein